ncbi:TPA: hypothetical protein DIV45_02650 [Patescibacteria group bacterium]|nr:hypothetical protein [Patescibacteria group bacterium]
MKKFNLVALAVILVASPLWSGWLQTTQAAYTATLTFANPANGASRALDANNRFTIDVMVNTAGQASIGADVLVDFDSTKLDFVAGGSAVANFYPANHYGPSVSGNRVSMGATKQAGGADINGSGRFATLQFGLKSGIALPTNVQFSFYYIAQGNTIDSNITSTNIVEPDLLAAPAAATITLTAYVPPATAPDITSIVPASGTTAGSTSVVVTGTNFGTAGAVTFGGTAVTPTGRTDTSMTVTSPAHAAGDVYIVVTNSTTGLTSGGADANARYTYVTPGSTTPSITNINPNQGPEAGGTSVVLTGTNFGATEGTVTIGGQTVNASNVTWTDTSITFTTPAYPVSGNLGVNVSITTSGNVASNAVTYTYTDTNVVQTNDPDIAYLNPNSGLADADVIVTIVGTNFKPTGTTTGTVRFGNYTATILSWEDTQIRVYAPKLGAIPSDISYTVTVTRSDGKYDTATYLYLAPASTGGTSTPTPASGMPNSVWAGLFGLNGGLAFLIKRKLTKYS